MSTQSYTTIPGTTNHHVTSPSRRRRWILAIAASVTVAFAALALVLWHAQSSAAPATNGPSTSTSVPAQPHTPANPAQPSRPAVNPAQPSAPTVNPAVPTTPAAPGSQS
jgi:flagellar basal body-associated protein FliL